LANKGGTLSQYVVQTLVVKKEDPYEDNPREAILRHAKVAEENPLYVAPAYKKYDICLIECYLCMKFFCLQQI
jgi:hypothetical protein